MPGKHYNGGKWLTVKIINCFGYPNIWYRSKIGWEFQVQIIRHDGEVENKLVYVNRRNFIINIENTEIVK